MGTPVGDQIRDLQSIFGGGVFGGTVAVIILSFLGLFVLYVRAKNAHLKTVEKLAPIADQMTDVLKEAVDELRESREVLQMHKPKRPKPARPLPPEPPTVIVPPGDPNKR